jgi:hypothetical protein
MFTVLAPELIIGPSANVNKKKYSDLKKAPSASETCSVKFYTIAMEQRIFV